MIYDCFSFFNELDVLELRLNTLSPVVDRFVLVESNFTHSNKPKELFFAKNRDRFAAFADRIIHVVVDNFPDNPRNNAWVFEHFQRNAIMRGLVNSKADDLILISDVDEIPRPEMIKQIPVDDHVYMFRQRMYYYYINCVDVSKRKSNASWIGTIGMRRDLLDKPQKFRQLGLVLTGLSDSRFLVRSFFRCVKFFRADLNGYRLKFLNDAGWHFSYLGGAQRVITKLEAFAHQEYNKPEFKDPDKIKSMIANGEDIFGRGFKYSFVPLDSSYPDYLLANKAKYHEFIHSDM
jgi:Glycosyltransferase family 17